MGHTHPLETRLVVNLRGTQNKYKLKADSYTFSVG